MSVWCETSWIQTLRLSEISDIALYSAAPLCFSQLQKKGSNKSVFFPKVRSKGISSAVKMFLLISSLLDFTRPVTYNSIGTYSDSVHPK